MYARCRESLHGRSGATLVLMVLLLTTIVTFTAFAIDLGIIFLERAQMQNAVDAGAVAASIYLSNDPDGILAAKEEAEKFIQLNRIGMMVTVPEDAIFADIGQWDDETGKFVATTIEPNAVRVTAFQGNERFFFSRFFGHTFFGIPGQAIASGNGQSLDIMMVLDLSGSMKDEGRIEALQNAAPTFVDVIEELDGDDRIGMMGLSADPSKYDPADEGHAGSLYQPAGLNPSGDHHVGVLEADLTDDFNLLRSTTLSSSTLQAWRRRRPEIGTTQTS
ncbi:MAG: pilus assembly protein TadG-related protein, partial [Pirellulales bacterium]|nr:pilus assembly protein TadG-related protein [Pirellulales bacterium]